MGGEVGALCREFSSSYSYFDPLCFLQRATPPNANGFIPQMQNKILDLAKDV